MATAAAPPAAAPSSARRLKRPDVCTPVEANDRGTRVRSAPVSADLFSVDGKVALVTGGSRGIGLMIARGLVAAGAQVVISSRKAEVCDAAAREIGAVSVPADLSRREGVEQLAAAVAERFDRVDLLVNNAGASWGAPLEDFPDSGWQKVMSTNVHGVFLLTVALLPQLRAAGDASVVNIGSIDGIRAPLLENYPYSASKAAVHMLTKHLAKRLAGERIRVNAIAPGPFASQMTKSFLGTEEARAAVGAQVPLGRIGTPEDVLGTTLFLASRAGAFLTGTVIPLDGGITGCGASL
jgi:NAD(P)-dependent dehydrogenase (short-subunit alcohol dehydrogenase family)